MVEAINPEEGNQASQQQVKVENLGAKPTANEHQLLENEAELEGYAGEGAFSADAQANSLHYNNYAAKYDTFHKVTGFNDPFEIAKTTIEKLGQPGQPLAEANARLLDFGCGTGGMG